MAFLKQEVEMMRKYQDDIIHDTVEQQVKARLLRLDVYDDWHPTSNVNVTPGRTSSVRPCRDGFTPRILNQTIHIQNVGNCQIHNIDENYNVHTGESDEEKGEME